VAIDPTKQKTMPGPLLLPLLQMGMSAASQAANMISQGNANRKNREFTEKMYNRQRQDSLSDWAMQNEYNSPQAQMERLRNANLNPNLVYGNGSVVANSQSMPRQASGQSYGHQPTQFNFQQGIEAFTDARVKQAQYDNLRVMNTNLLLDGIAKTIGNKTKQFDLGLKEQLRQLSIDMAYAAKENMQAGTGLKWTQQMATADRNQREQEVHEKLTVPMIANRLQQAAEDLYMKQFNSRMTENQQKILEERIKLMEKDGRLKDLEIKLNANGLQNSPWYIRAGSKLLEDLF